MSTESSSSPVTSALRDSLAAAARDPNANFRGLTDGQIRTLLADGYGTALDAIQKMPAQYQQSIASAFLQLAQDLNKNDIEMAKMRYQQMLATLTKAVNDDTTTLRGIEQTKAGFAGLTSVIEIIARACGANDFADKMKDMTEALKPTPIDPVGIERIEGYRESVRSLMTPEQFAALEGNIRGAETDGLGAIGRAADATGDLHVSVQRQSPRVVVPAAPAPTPP